MAMLGWGWAGVVCASGLIAVGLEANWAAYVLLAGWAVLGCGYYLWQRLRIKVSQATVKLTSG
jgi:APA family basic amino acid/polyamine antiporter